MWCFILRAPGVKRGNCGVPLKNAVLSDEAHTNIRTHTHTQTHVASHNQASQLRAFNTAYNADAFIRTLKVGFQLD